MYLRLAHAGRCKIRIAIRYAVLSEVRITSTFRMMFDFLDVWGIHLGRLSRNLSRRSRLLYESCMTLSLESSTSKSNLYLDAIRMRPRHNIRSSKVPETSSSEKSSSWNGSIIAKTYTNLALVHGELSLYVDTLGSNHTMCYPEGHMLRYRMPRY